MNHRGLNMKKIPTFCQDYSSSDNNHHHDHHDQSHTFSSHNCQACLHYEEDIAILQQKLLATHNKLIKQLDIISLKQLQKNQQNSSQNRSSNSKISFSEKKRDQTTRSPGKISYLQTNTQNQQQQHSIQPLIQTKNQLLKNDLEAMRNKVLSQIMKANKIKQSLQGKQQEYQSQVNQYRQKIKRLQINRNTLMDENQKLKTELYKYENQYSKNRKNKCNCGFEQKYYELDQAFMNQRTITTQLIQENNQLQNQMYEEKLKNIQNITSKNNNSNKVFMENINHHNLVIDGHREQKKIIRSKQKQKVKKKTDFQETKNLIYKLQQAEKQIRYRK